MKCDDLSHLFVRRPANFLVLEPARLLAPRPAAAVPCIVRTQAAYDHPRLELFQNAGNPFEPKGVIRATLRPNPADSSD